MSKCNSTSINPPKQSKIRAYGVGYNSKGFYKTGTLEHRTWLDMLRRCYCPKDQAKRPTYVGCSVHPDWHDFQVFAEWYTKHEYYGKGYQLDKDILIKGNKVYSPDTCCLIPSQINSLFLESASRKGAHPVGVDFKNGKFRAQIRKNGKKKDLGYFRTADEAHQAYITSKQDYVRKVAQEYKGRVCNRTYQALINWKY